MTELEQYVNELNWYRVQLMRERPLDPVQDWQRIFDRLDCDLSPENLTCDGELPRDQVRQRYEFLTRAQQQLVDLVDG
jgi:hypothetical protein